jgi:UDP-glucose 4-epimerase
MESNLVDEKVLVTGGAGFLGSHVVDILLEKGAKPIVIDNSTRGSREYVNNNAEFINGDLTDPEIADIATQQADWVFHLAAVVGDVAYMLSNPYSIYENIVIDYNIFSKSVDNNINKLLYTSSACVYPTNLQDTEYKQLSEKDAYQHGANPDGDYGWTKVVGEQMAKSINSQTELSVSIVRPFNPYGPRESFDPQDSHVIPAFIRRATEREDPFIIWGSGEQVRTFTYVTDVAKGMIEAMLYLDGGQTTNLTSTESTTISELAETVLEIAGYDPKIKYDQTKPEGVRIREPAKTGVLKSMPWSAEVDLKQGIKRTYDWYGQESH